MNDYRINEGNQIGYLPTEFGASGNSIIEKKLVAATDVKKGRVAVVTDALTVGHSSEPSANVLGVFMFDAKAGEPVSVETEGFFYLVASGAITAPVKVAATTDGKVKAAVEGDATCGLAITDTTADGQLVAVKFSI